MVGRTYLTRLREKAGLSIHQFAVKSGIDYATYYRIEAGQKMDLTVLKIIDIAYALGVDAMELLKAEIDWLNGGANNDRA